MYSYEDRVRAVRLYVRLGKRIAATIRQLGCPTKNTLKSWHREYEQRLDLPTGYVRLPGYSQAQNQMAVEHYLEHGRCVSATIKNLGYPGWGSLPAWVQEPHPEARPPRCWQIPRADARTETGRGHRVVHATRKRAGGCSTAWREQADVVQLEESATQPRGTRIHETPARIPAMP